MRYEIAVFLGALEDYRSRTGGYYPVETTVMADAIATLRAKYGKLETQHDETIMEIMYAKPLIRLATALSDFDRGIAVALLALRLREQQADDQERERPAFHITWLDERYKLLNFYGQLLEEEKDAMFQLALDALRARGVLPPLPE